MKIMAVGGSIGAVMRYVVCKMRRQPIPSSSRTTAAFAHDVADPEHALKRRADAGIAGCGKDKGRRSARQYDVGKPYPN